MCDDHTEQDNQAFLTRRGFARAAAGVAIAGAASACGSAAAPGTGAAGRAISESAVTVPTPDGQCDAFFVHPAQGKGPAVIMWPDIMGLREANRTIARKIAQEGYAVLAVNLYYRSKPAPTLPPGVSFMSDEGKAILGPMIPLLTPEAYATDTKAFVAWLDARPEVDTAHKIGAMGFCLTGPAVIRAAAAAPERVGAGASFHGGGLVTDKPDSPHLLIPQSQASYLFAIAQNDDARDPTVKDVLRKTADEAHRPAEIEVYPAQHGWTMPDFPVHDQVQADRAFSRMFALYKSAL